MCIVNEIFSYIYEFKGNLYFNLYLISRVKEHSMLIDLNFCLVFPVKVCTTTIGIVEVSLENIR